MSHMECRTMRNKFIPTLQQIYYTLNRMMYKIMQNNNKTLINNFLIKMTHSVIILYTLLYYNITIHTMTVKVKE